MRLFIFNIFHSSIHNVQRQLLIHSVFRNIQTLINDKSLHNKWWYYTRLKLGYIHCEYRGDKWVEDKPSGVKKIHLKCLRADQSQLSNNGLTGCSPTASMRGLIVCRVGGYQILSLKISDDNEGLCSDWFTNWLRIVGVYLCHKSSENKEFMRCWCIHFWMYSCTQYFANSPVFCDEWLTEAYLCWFI